MPTHLEERLARALPHVPAIHRQALARALERPEAPPADRPGAHGPAVPLPDALARRLRPQRLLWPPEDLCDPAFVALISATLHGAPALLECDIERLFATAALRARDLALRAASALARNARATAVLSAEERSALADAFHRAERERISRALGENTLRTLAAHPTQVRFALELAAAAPAPAFGSHRTRSHTLEMRARCAYATVHNHTVVYTHPHTSAGALDAWMQRTGTLSSDDPPALLSLARADELIAGALAGTDRGAHSPAQASVLRAHALAQSARAALARH